jgi:hypothetical protein
MGFEQLANHRRLGQFQIPVQLLPLAGRKILQLPQPAGKGLFFHGDASFSEPSPSFYAFTTLNSDRAMKNAIDDADYVIDWIFLIIIIQCVTNSAHSHSMVAGGLPDMS